MPERKPEQDSDPEWRAERKSDWEPELEADYEGSSGRMERAPALESCANARIRAAVEAGARVLGGTMRYAT